MCQVLGNFFGGTNCVGIGPYTTDERMDPGDNGIYVIEGWKIVERVGLYDGFVEQQEYDFDQMLRDFDSSMPAGDRLGEFLDSVEVPVGELQVGDEVWLQGADGTSTESSSSPSRSPSGMQRSKSRMISSKSHSCCSTKPS